MPKEVVAARSDSTRQVNALIHPTLKTNHSPAPCSKSALNARAREWWASHETSHGRKVDGDGGLQIPSNWPNHVVYVTQNLVAPSIPESIATRYVLPPSTAAAQPTHEPTAGPSSPANLPRATHNDGRLETLYTTLLQYQVPLIIHRIDNDTPWCPDSFHSTSRKLSCHPAAGSFGLFAAQDIAPNTFIRPYLGVLHAKADADFYSTYDLSLCHDPRLAVEAQPGTVERLADDIDALSLENETDPTALYLDSRHWGNESRFVNDYRGIATKPNVEFRSFLQSPEQGGEPRFQMGLFAVRPIHKGRELLINYGKSFWVHFEQLIEMQSREQPKSAPPAKKEQGGVGERGETEHKLDPIQAMLQSSRMRVAKTGRVEATPSAAVTHIDTLSAYTLDAIS